MNKWYPYIVYYFGLGMIYSTSLLGLSVVGSDISRELLMSSITLRDGWDLNLLDPSNTSVVVGFLIPWVSTSLDIPVVWVYKAILPAVFAFCPLILYFIFKKQIGSLRAFFAAIFFIIVPVFSLEIASIGKSMVAETLMVLTFWVMFTNLKSWIKCIVMLVLVILTMWSHYTIGIMLVAYLLCTLLIMLGIKLFKNWKLWDRKTISLWVVVVVLVCSIIPFYWYYSTVSEGLITNILFGIAPVRSTDELKALTETLSVASNSDVLVKIGVGNDFIEASILGKMFRIVQYSTQILIIIGSLWLLFKHRLYKFKAEFVACIGGSFILLLFCIFIPNFASLINMTRFYHISLFFLAPMFVLGFDVLSKGRVKID